MANGVCDSYCKGCVYCQLASGDATFVCVYFLKTNIRRPCPAGTGCTVKETGKKHNVWRQMTDEEWKQRERERNRLRREKKRKAKMRTVICPICGKAFQTSDSRKMYCSKECSYEANRRRWNEKKPKKLPGTDASDFITNNT